MHNTLASSLEPGSLGVFHLKRLWSAAMLERSGKKPERGDEWLMDSMLMDALGLGKHQTMQMLFQSAPAFNEFEQWVVDTAGRPSELLVKRVNAQLAGEPRPESVRQWLEAIDECPGVLTEKDLECWSSNGYVVLKNAVDADECTAARNLLWEHVGANPKDLESWYGGRTHGMMLELIQHPALQANRNSPRIHKAYAQLWQTADLWVSADRCSFHPPQRAGFPFPGPDLHWDVDFDQPLSFGTQGVLYLSDTPAEQGALTLVPGFHRKIKQWRKQLPPGSDPNSLEMQALHALGSVPIEGKAGDLVIWHQWLPHGSRPNLGTKPRLVQYINMNPMVRVAATPSTSH